MSIWPKTQNVKKRVAEELADVLFYLVRTASVMGIDLNQAAIEKLALNEQKYPADKARGSHKNTTSCSCLIGGTPP